jgi:outer membrane immunogenic protein
MKILLLLPAVSLIPLAAPAHAAKPEGFRAELLVGADQLRRNFADFGLGDRHTTGLLYGVGTGYDFGVSDTAALGVDAEFTDFNTDFDFALGGDSARLTFGRDLYAGLRGTFSVADRVNLYVRAGGSLARLTTSTTIGGTTFVERSNGLGARVGGGVQFELGPNVYTGAEYRYTNYGSGYSRHQVAATLGWRF